MQQIWIKVSINELVVILMDCNFYGVKTRTFLCPNLFITAINIIQMHRSERPRPLYKSVNTAKFDRLNRC